MHKRNRRGGWAIIAKNVPDTQITITVELDREDALNLYARLIGVKRSELLNAHYSSTCFSGSSHALSILMGKPTFVKLEPMKL